MKLAAFKSQATNRLGAAGVDTPNLDARLLIMHAGKWEAADLILRGDEDLPEDIQDTITALIDRRVAGEPIDHILEQREFYARLFRVTNDVLSPRPETEGLVDIALDAIGGLNSPRLLDLGTGSGAIAVSILAEAPGASSVATDISDAALNIARENAASHNVSARLTFLRSHWFEDVSGQFDVIISNPPYITDEAMTELSPEVKNFDPDTALRGGPDGLAPYYKIIAQAQNYLTPGGWLILEIGYDQGSAVVKLMKKANFTDIRLLPDLSGHDRIVTGRNTK